MIEFNPVSRGISEDAGLIQKAVDRVLRSGRLILGPEVEAFEHEWAEWTGARFCIGVASGTDALKIALRACGIDRHGDDPELDPVVLTQANSAPATASAIRDAGARPYFLDVCCFDRGVFIENNGRWGCANPASLRWDTIAALVPVSIYGLPGRNVGGEFADCLDRTTRAITDIRNGVVLVHDLCQRHDRGVWAEERSGHPTRREAACFSFYPTKALGAIGDGGAIVTDSERIAAACRELRQYGYESPEVVGRDGWNSRLDEVQAAVLRERLRLHPRREAHRAALAAIYRERAKADGWESRLVAGSHVVAGLFPDRGAAQAALADAGIGTRIHYRVPLHQHPAYAYARHVELLGTERWCRETLSLPYSNWTTEAEARTAAAAASRIMVAQMEVKKT